MKTFVELRTQLNEGKRLKSLVMSAALTLGGLHMAHAQETPTVTPQEQSHTIGHQSIHQAVMTGMHTCKSTVPHHLECGFGIYKHADGLYYHTKVQNGKYGSIDKMEITYPKKARLMAFCHTHPQDPNLRSNDTSIYFSHEDIDFAKRTGLHMYMGSHKSGKVTEYIHGKTKKSPHAVLGYYSAGKEVGPFI